VLLSLANVREICEPACFSRFGLNTDDRETFREALVEGSVLPSVSSHRRLPSTSPARRVRSRKRLPCLRACKGGRGRCGHPLGPGR